MKSLLLTTLLTLGLAGAAFGQQSLPPCGPSGDLPDELGGNVADDSRCFEIRMYTAAPEEAGVGGINNLHQRFREAEVGIFERLGAEVVAVWQRMDDPNTLVWMLAYRNRDHRQEVWTAFRTDAEWVALREKYPVSVSAEVYFLSASDYSNLK